MVASAHLAHGDDFLEVTVKLDVALRQDVVRNERHSLVTARRLCRPGRGIDQRMSPSKSDVSGRWSDAVQGGIMKL